MAAGVTTQDTSQERWKKAFLGPLSNDFLRISTSRDVQEAADAALALSQQQAIYNQTYPSAVYMAPNIVGRLSITVAQAKLVKNYGLTRMDPYVRIRVGHFIYETQTDPKGGKTPHWNRVIHSQLPSGVHSIFLEIYDECSFTMDELVAWAEIKIPDAVLRGETHEEWYPLSGKQGDDVEGMVDLVFSFVSATTEATAPGQQVLYQQAPANVMVVPNVSGRPLPVYISPRPVNSTVPGTHPQQLPPQQPPAPPPVFNEEDVKQISEMFPNMDKDVIKSVYEVNRFSKDNTINSLLQLSEQ